MPSGDTTLTVAGNLTADPDLRYTQVSREFTITDGMAAGNWMAL